MKRTKKLLACLFIASIALLSLGRIGLAAFRGEAVLRNLVADGDMENTTVSGWSLSSGTVASKQTANPHGGSRSIRVAGPGGASYYISRTLFTVGKNYRISGWAHGDGTSAPQVWDDGLGAVWIGTSSLSWQHFDVNIRAIGTGLALLTGAAGAVYVEFDDIQVTEVKSNENAERSAIADGDMEKTNPAVALLDGNMEAAAATTTDGGAWTSYQVFLSKSTASPHSGTRALRLSFDGTNTFGEAYQTNLTSGHTYHLTAWMRGDGTINPVISDTAGTWVNGSSTTTWQAVDVTKVMTGTFFNFASAFLSAGHWVEFDDITITDVTAGSWAPDLNSGTLISKSTTSPHGGNQVLHVASINTDANNYFGVDRYTIGKTYRVTGWARGDGTRQPRIGDSPVWMGTNSTAWQRIDVTAKATGVKFYLYAYGAGAAGTYAEFDDIQVVEVKGRQENVQRNLLADGDMENSNAAPAAADLDMELAAATTTDGGAWTAATSFVAKVAGARTGGAGARYLRVSANGAATGYASQANGLVSGHTYYITGWVRGDGANALPRVYGGNTAYFSGTTSTSWQFFNSTMTQTINNSFNPFCSMPGNVGHCDFDDITITDVTAGSYSVGNSAIASKQTTNPHSGRQVIRITKNGAANPYVFGGSLVIGKRYRATGWARGDGNCAPHLADASVGIFYSGTTSANWQYINASLLVTGSALQMVSITCGVDGQYTEWDDVSVTLDE